MQVLNCATDTDSSSAWHGISRGEEADWKQEVDCLMRLSHRSVVHLVGVVTSSRPWFIVTELAAHGSLKDCLRHNDFFALSDFHTLLKLCTQVIDISHTTPEFFNLFFEVEPFAAVLVAH